MQRVDHALPRRKPGSHVPRSAVHEEGRLVGQARVGALPQTRLIDDHTMRRLIEALRAEAVS